ncbi:MAG: alpha/beta fold hydrolase [Proteobacteria bacterium]|nr:alpha/beta fold hydrolase [Pseudomonadota bacterium]
MPTAPSNGIELHYECFGDPGAAPLLLVMGLGGQMILWDEEFCEQLADRGYQVIRFDNRDVGCSTWFADAGVPNPLTVMQAVATGQSPEVPYRLEDMAADTCGLLDHLGIERAHVVGASMGGMIAQSLAIANPERVRTLTSIMSTTGNPELPPAKPEVMQLLMSPSPTERQAVIEHSLQMWKVIGSPGFPLDEERVRSRAARQFDRGFQPEGTARQMAAIVASGSRVDGLRELRVPTLVIHGVEDVLVPVSGGKDTADCVPDAKLLLIEGMGHDMPVAVWPQLLDAIDGHAGSH